jgi:hypothetical protein
LHHLKQLLDVKVIRKVGVVKLQEVTENVVNLGHGFDYIRVEEFDWLAERFNFHCFYLFLV